MYTPVNPSFTTSKCGLRGSKLYGHVFVMVFNKRSGVVVMSPDSESIGAAVVAGVGSNLTAQWFFKVVSI